MESELIDTDSEISAFLTSTAAESILSVALHTLGWELVDYWCDKPYIRPGAGVSVGYFVTARGSDREFSTYLTATTESVDNSQAVLTFTDPEGIVVDPIYVWQFPNDPSLPALALATDMDEMSRRMPEFEDLDASIVVYRPTRRAVVEYTSAGTSVAFGKVLQPATAAELVRRTTAVGQGEAPVPAIIFYDDSGLGVSEAAKGVGFSNIIAFDPDRAISMISDLEACLDALPAEVADLNEHKSWSKRVSHYASSAAALMPSCADAIHEMDEYVNATLAEDRGGPDVPTHGDFFEANILVDDDGRLTLIDLDHVGPGKRNDDWGCLLAHVGVLPFLLEEQWVDADPSEPFRERLEEFNPGGKRCSFYPNSERVLEEWCQYLDQRTDPVDLYARACAVGLSIASNADVHRAPREAAARIRRAIWWMERSKAAR